VTQYLKPERDERASLKAMLIALDASETTLKRDVVRGEGRTGDWGIRGSTDRAGNDANVADYLLYATTPERDYPHPDDPNRILTRGSARRWENIKRILDRAAAT
jgi:hypothetical protein